MVHGTGRLAGTTDALWLEMHHATDGVAVDSEGQKGVQGASEVYDLSGTSGRAGYEYAEADIRLIVDLDSRASRS